MEILSRIHVALALSELCRGLDGLSSCFNLIPATARPTRERLGLELARVEARRAGRLSQNLKVLLDDPPLAPGPVDLGELLRRIIEGMDEELQLSRVLVSIEVGRETSTAQGDPAALTLALSAMLGALVAIAETASPDRTVKLSIAERDGTVSLRAHASALLQESQIARLLDLDWTDRPGGVAAAIGLTAARRVAQLHGGRVDAVAHPTGGFVLGLTLPIGT